MFRISAGLIWFLRGGRARCGVMTGCAAPIYLSECDELVRATAAAAGERLGQDMEILVLRHQVMVPERQPGATRLRLCPGATGRSWPLCRTGSRGTCRAGSGCRRVPGRSCAGVGTCWQRQDLQLLVPVTHQQQPHEREHAGHTQVGKSKQHKRSSCRSGRPHGSDQLIRLCKTGG